MKCKNCGCIMPDDHDGDMCEVCLDELNGNTPDMLIEPESRDPTIYIFDIEVFSDDWIVIFRRPEENAPHIVIHNDNAHLREFVTQPDIIIGGFNNKHYDNWIVLTMILGGSNVEVKRHNDYIINEGGNGWDFPFIKFQKIPFKSFDLRDDIADKGISLKAIEGNLKLPIVESSVPFDIDRKLTAEELEEVIRYCKHDVDATISLYFARKTDYIDAKRLVAEMYDVPIDEAYGLTNAKLSARVLGAKHTERSDERNYILPDNIDPDYIPKIVMDFFMQIKDLSIPDLKLFGSGKAGAKGEKLKLWYQTSRGKCPVTYAWGGVHGAKPCVIIEETADRVIINQDVGSLYPNSMINFGYCSRSMEDPEAYVKLVKRRLGYKHSGDKVKANALKLVVNTVYGAMLNLYNDLADRWAGRSVCISNQLAMTVLIVQLGQACKTIDFVNINTDGIMFTIDRSEVELSEQIVAAWCEITKFEMERDDFIKVIQKDVNNYIGIMPQIDKATGKHKFKVKGGFVSLYNGGNFKTNSLQIIDRAVVDKLVYDIPIETTINECNDIFAFQNIVKTGSTYEGAYQYVNGERRPLQNVNRIYAVTDPAYGKIVKGKWITERRRKDPETGKMISSPVVPPVWSETEVSECPDHPFVDNENTLDISQLDKQYYIDMAEKRVDKYINLDRKVENELNKIKEVVNIMATKSTAAKAADNAEIRDMNIYGKLTELRLRFLAADVKKTGKNTYAEFMYFTLGDIVPVKNQIEKDLGLVDYISFYPKTENGEIIAELTLVNVDHSDEKIYFMSPIAADESLIKNPIQKLGAVETYIRRYLYMLLLDIVEADAIDATSGKPNTTTGEKAAPKPKSKRPATDSERAETKEQLINKTGAATDTQIKAVKSGLKKLRETGDDSYEEYITSTIKSIKKGLTKEQADNLLIEIGDKVAKI